MLTGFEGKGILGRPKPKWDNGINIEPKKTGRILNLSNSEQREVEDRYELKHRGA